MRTKEMVKHCINPKYTGQRGEKWMGVKGSVTRNRKIEPKVAGNWKGARAEKFLKVQTPSLASIYRGPVALPMGGEGAIKDAKPVCTIFLLC